MDLGVTHAFQSAYSNLTDYEVYKNEREVALMAEPLGFDSVWTTEHHFTEYEMIPSPVQFLSYMAGATKRVKLGTMVIVIPWHDPIRVAEEISLLENLSDSRMILGVGRGLGRVEFEAFRVPMDESRTRFNEHATAILDSLETGFFELDGTYVKQPRVALRPAPIRSFRDRTYVAGQSAETMPLAAKLGLGQLLIPARGWDEMQQVVSIYNEHWAVEQPGRPRPRPLVVGFVYVDRDGDRAKAMAYRHISEYWRAVAKHYEFASGHLKNLKGYEGYRATAAAVEEDMDKFVSDFVDQMVWGTPDEVVEKVADLRKRLDMGTFIAHFTYSGMPHADAKASMNLFASSVLPVLHDWDVPSHVASELVS